MRRLVLLAGLALAVGVLLPGSALPAAGGSNLPLKGSHSGYVTTNLATGQAHAVTSGTISHFGLSTTDQHIQAVPTGPGTFSWSATWTATAANGDQMFGTATGTVIYAPDGIHSTSLGTYTSSGGTGRFANASLSLNSISQDTRISVVGTTVTLLAEVTVEGTLSY